MVGSETSADTTEEDAMARTGHYRYRRNRARVLRKADVCAICGQTLNPDIKWPDPWCVTADHIVPIADGGHNNGPLQVVHRICNQRRWQQTVRHGRAW